MSLHVSAEHSIWWQSLSNMLKMKDAFVQWNFEFELKRSRSESWIKRLGPGDEVNDYITTYQGEKKATALYLWISEEPKSLSMTSNIWCSNTLHLDLFIKHRNSKELWAVGAHSVIIFPATKKIYLPWNFIFASQLYFLFLLRLKWRIINAIYFLKNWETK